MTTRSRAINDQFSPAATRAETANTASNTQFPQSEKTSQSRHQPPGANLGAAAISSALSQAAEFGELEAWKQVPNLVAERYKEAANIKHTLAKVIKHLPVADPGYGHVYWNPENKTVWAVLSDGDTDQVHQKWHNALKAISGVNNVRTESEYGPYNDPDWIRIKRASALSWLGKPYEWAGKLTGGPSPMSNALVSGLLGAGLGYGGGMLAEHLLPERFVRRGRLRKTLATLGGLGGAALHIPQGMANAGINREATGKSHWLRSFMRGDNAQQMAPHELDFQRHYYNQPQPTYYQNQFQNTPQLQTAKIALQKFPVSSRLKKANEEFIKQAFQPSGLFGSPGVPLRPVPVDSFNQVIWNDVHNGRNSSQSNPYGTRSPYSDNTDVPHTPPAHAAAATGLVSGVQQMYGGSPLLSPKHFIRGLAAAGVDAATAHVAGGVLGALGGLTPAAQKQLQDIGVWSGMIRGVTGSVLGLR